MEDYRKKTLEMIRRFGGRLEAFSDDALSDLYHEWSEMTYSAGWWSPHQEHVKRFCEWATTAPCDRKTPNA